MQFFTCVCTNDRPTSFFICHDIQLIDTYRNYNNTSFVNTKSVKDEKPQNSTKKSTKNSKLEMQELEKKIIDLPEASSVPENFGDDNLNGSHQDIYQPDVGLGVIESPDQSCIINQINFNNSETAISEKILEQNSLASLTDDDNDEIVQNVNDDKIIEKPTDIPKNEIKNAESVSIPDQTDDDSGSESNEIEMNIGLGFYDDMRPQDFSNFLKDDRFESDNSIVCFEDEDENDASFSKMDDQLITSLSQPQNMKIAEQNNKTDETHNNQPYHQSLQFQLLLEEQAEYILKSQSHFLKFKKLMSSKDDNFNNSQDSSDTSSSEEDDDSDVDSDDDMNDDKNDDDKENKCEVDQKGENIVNANYFTEDQKSFLLKVYEDSQNDFKVNSHNQNNKNGEFDSVKAKQICESVPDPIEKCETPMPDPDQSGTKNNNSEKSMSQRRPLPFKTRRTPEMTLVLDLDETLVHATLTPIDDADMIFKVEMPDGLKYPIHVKISGLGVLEIVSVLDFDFFLLFNDYSKTPPSHTRPKTLPRKSLQTLRTSHLHSLQKNLRLTPNPNARPPQKTNPPPPLSRPLPSKHAKLHQRLISVRPRPQKNHNSRQLTPSLLLSNRKWHSHKIVVW